MSCIFIDEHSADTLVYDTGGVVEIFDTTLTQRPLNRTIIIRNHTSLQWYGFTTWWEEYCLHFINESGESHVHILLLAHKNHVQSTVHSTLTASHTKTNIHIISLVGNEGIINLNGVVEIGPQIEKVSGHILEENIFLGSTGQIRWIPSLLVHSDDVEAWHAARIERIPDEKLYYLRARGIPQEDATIMMIRSAIFWLFSGLDIEQKDAIISRILALV